MKLNVWGQMIFYCWSQNEMNAWGKNLIQQDDELLSFDSPDFLSTIIFHLYKIWWICCWIIDHMRLRTCSNTRYIVGRWSMLSFHLRPFYWSSTTSCPTQCSKTSSCSCSIRIRRWIHLQGQFLSGFDGSSWCWGRLIARPRGPQESKDHKPFFSSLF